MNKECCDRTSALIKLSLDYNTFCASVGVSLKLKHFCNKVDCFKKFINSHFSLCRNGNTDNIAAPFLGNKLVLCELLHNSVGVCTLFIHFVDCNYNFNAGSLCVVDSLNCLRHNTVVCGYNKHCNIRCHCTSCTHCGECGVTRCVKESDCLLVGCNNLICADSLGDTACLGGGYIGVSDCVEDRCLAVVNVTHYANNGRTRNCILIVFVVLFDDLLLDCDNNFFLNLCAKFCCNNFGCIVVDNLVYINHHTEFHQCLDNLGCRHTKA